MRNRIDFPEQHWRQDRAPGRTGIDLHSKLASTTVNAQRSQQRGDADLLKLELKVQIKKVEQLDNPRSQFYIEGNKISRSQSATLDWTHTKKVQSQHKLLSRISLEKVLFQTKFIKVIPYLLKIVRIGVKH